MQLIKKLFKKVRSGFTIKEAPVEFRPAIFVKISSRPDNIQYKAAAAAQFELLFMHNLSLT